MSPVRVLYVNAVGDVGGGEVALLGCLAGAPRAEDVEKFIYAPSPVDKVYPGDYTGLP